MPNAPTAPPPAANPIRMLVPPDEKFWKRYSPHNEAPLSGISSFALHLLAIPLLLIRDYISGALVLQFLLEPFPGMYVASAVPLGVLGDRRSKYLIPASFLTLPAYASVGQAWATVLALIVLIATGLYTVAAAARAVLS